MRQSTVGDISTLHLKGQVCAFPIPMQEPADEILSLVRMEALRGGRRWGFNVDPALAILRARIGGNVMKFFRFKLELSESHWM